MNRPLLWLALAVLSATALSCAPGGKSEGDRTLTVYAAASLTDAFNELGPAFERAHPGWRVRVSYGASSTLRTQIEQGAPADLFASADWQQMEPLAGASRVETPVAFARNRLAIAVPEGNPGGIRSPRDLARPGLRLVTAAGTVPVGRYTQEALEKLGRMEGYPNDFAGAVNRSVVSQESNVRAVLAKVELGEADAGIVYETDFRSSAHVKAVEIPAGANVEASYPIAVVAGTRNAEGARELARFVTGEAGQAILRRHGFR
ncbi:MAG: molybdate ABC transporter substrate-binding protein [Armatimonadota bacterium]